MAFEESRSFAFGLHQKSVVEAVAAVAVAEGFGTCKEEMKFDGGILDFCQDADVIYTQSIISGEWGDFLPYLTDWKLLVKVGVTVTGRLKDVC